jgi:hypothetical protein
MKRHLNENIIENKRLKAEADELESTNEQNENQTPKPIYFEQKTKTIQYKATDTIIKCVAHVPEYTRKSLAFVMPAADLADAKFRNQSTQTSTSQMIKCGPSTSLVNIGVIDEPISLHFIPNADRKHAALDKWLIDRYGKRST